MTADAVAGLPSLEQIRKAGEELDQARLSGVPPETLVWLAAMPEWSVRLALQAGFPTSASQSMPALVEQFAAAGLVETGEDVDDDGELVPTFWLPTSQRGRVGTFLRRSFPPGSLGSVVAEMGRAVDEVLRSSPGFATPSLRAWVEVARRDVFDASGLELMTQIDRLLEQGSTEAAVCLVSSAECLGNVLGEPLVSTARRAQWRVDRGYRAALDARSLRGYLPRSEVDGDLLELVTERGDWALHLIGDGGVGKTMSVRDLASGGFARRHGLRPFPVARIDFDHLDPRYPDIRPGELLLALAGDLVSFARDREASYRLRRLDDAVAALHEAMAAPDLPPDSHELDFDRAIDLFAEFTRHLGPTVVLVLDTCEELAKLTAPGVPSRAVERTFRLIRRACARHPGLKVVFAGRRPLQIAASAAGLTLRVHEIRGFTSSLARQFLDGVPGPLAEAVLARCVEPDGTANPFDLAAYRQWCRDDPGLDPAVVRSAAGDPYVEQRILARISEGAVRAALPAAVELGRLELAMIAPTLRRQHVDPEAAFSGLAAQEWVSALSFHADGRPRVIELRELLRPRLRAVLRARSDQYPLDRARLGADLAEMIDGAEHVEDLAIEAVEGALQLLPISAAADLWKRFESRILDDDAWAWAGQVLPRIAAVEASRLEAGGASLFAAVRATQAAAALRLPGAPGFADLWRDVAQSADRHPHPEEGDRLALRAEWASPVEQVASWPAREASPDTMLAALEAITARGGMEGSSTTRPVFPEQFRPAVTLLYELCEDARPLEIRSAAKILMSTLNLDWGNPGEAETYALSAVSELESEDEMPTGHARRWLDWTAPQLLHRARLALALAWSAQGKHSGWFPREWLTQAADHLEDIDAERLASAFVAWSLAWGLPRQEDVLLLDAAETYEPGRQPSHRLHQLVEPLRCTLAEAFVATGETERARRMLRDRRNAAVERGTDPVTADQCDAKLVQLSLTAREVLTSHVNQATRSTDPEVREEAWAVVALVDNRRPSNPEEAGGWHSWWRVQPASIARAVEQPLVEGTPVNALDVAEWELLHGREISTTRVFADSPLPLRLRWAELTDQPLAVEGPPRQVAEVAVREGELLVLRLPQAGIRLLDYAVNRFETSGDQLGAARADVLAVEAGREKRPESWAAAGWSALAESGPGWATLVERARTMDGPRPPGQIPPGHPPLAVGRPAQLSTALRGLHSPGRWQIAGAGVALLAFAVAPALLRLGLLLLVVVVVSLLIWYRSRRKRRSPSVPCLVIDTRPSDEMWREGNFLPDSGANFAETLASPLSALGTTGPSRTWQRSQYRLVLLRPVSAYEAAEQVIARLAPDLVSQEPTLVRPGRGLGAQVNGVEYQGPGYLNSLRLDDAGRPARIAVGTPVETKVGWRFGLLTSSSDDEGEKDPGLLGSSFDYAPQSSYEPSASGSGRAGRSAGSLLGPDELFAGAELTVLMAEPVDGRPRPLGTLRDGMTALTAARTPDLRVPVLIVPPLPDRLVGDVLRLVAAKALAGPTPGRFVVLDLLTEVRALVRAEQVVEAGGDRPDLDVILFL